MSVDREAEAEANAEADTDADAEAEAEAESRNDSENEVKSTGCFLFTGTFEKLVTSQPPNGLRSSLNMSYSLKGQVRAPNFSLMAPDV